MRVSVKKLDEKAIIPSYCYAGDSGMDLYSIEKAIIFSGKSKLIRTGIAISIHSTAIEAQVRPKSGIAFNYGVTVLNTPGTIDSGYTGEIKVLLINHGSTNYTIQDGEKIAQLVFAPIIRVELVEAEEFNYQEGLHTRADKGFGSSGIANTLPSLE